MLTQPARLAHSTEPFFSFIVPVYNRRDLLARCLDSLLRQTFEAYEAIIIDDGSTEDIASVVDGYASDKLFLFRQENQGAAAARNFAVREKARGRFVVVVDSDDEVLPEQLQLIYEMIQATGCAVCFCGNMTVDAEGEVVREIMPAPLPPMFRGIEGNLATGAYAIERSAYLDVGGFDTRLPNRIATEFFMRLSDYLMEHGLTTAAVHEPLVRTHQHAGTRMGTNNEKRYVAWTTIAEKHRERLEEMPDMHARVLRWAAGAAARAGMYRQARVSLVRTIRRRPDRKDLIRLFMLCLPVARAYAFRPEPSYRASAESTRRLST